MKPRTAALVCSFAFLFGMFLARAEQLQRFVFGAPPFEAKVGEVYDILRAYYVDPIDDPAKLQNGAVRGMLEALGDPYTEFVPGDLAEQFDKGLTGHYVGIGAEVAMPEGMLTIMSPLPGSPALEAGLRAGDQVLAIAGKPTAGLTVDECIALIKGKPRTGVVMRVRRDGDEFDITVVRDTFTVNSVRGLIRERGDGAFRYAIDPARGVAYIRLEQFTPTSPADMRRALSDAREELGGAIDGLLLDLRGNPGGDLDACVEIADLFLGAAPVVRIVGRDGDEKVRKSSARAAFPDAPMAVLIDDISASASEIVAGALSDHERAIVVGERSFGKGLVQAVQPLRTNPKDRVKFTIQRYYLPSGRAIHRHDDDDTWGVDPSPGYFVPTELDRDIERMRTRRELDVILTADAPPSELLEDGSDPASVVAALDDPQLTAALDALRARVDTGSWPTREDAQDRDEMLAAIANGARADLLRARERLELEIARIDERLGVLTPSEEIDAEEATDEPADDEP